MRGEIQMNDAEFDRMLAANILGADGEILPSAEFAASVMAAVQSEAAIKAPLPLPPSTPFPWTTALGGLLACLILAGVTTASLMRMQTQPAPSASPAQQAQMPHAVRSMAQISHTHVDIAWVENGATNLANLAADQGAKLPSLLIQTEQQAANMGVGWLLSALLLSWATVQFSLYLADS